MNNARTVRLNKIIEEARSKLNQSSQSLPANADDFVMRHILAGFSDKQIVLRLLLLVNWTFFERGLRRQYTYLLDEDLVTIKNGLIQELWARRRIDRESKKLNESRKQAYMDTPGSAI